MISKTLIDKLECPICKTSLVEVDSKLICSNSHEFQIVNGIPRFVESDKYVKSFSLEWIINRVTQYDTEFPSKNNYEPIFIAFDNYNEEFDEKHKQHPFVSNWDVENPSETYDNFTIKTGIKPEDLKGKKVLDVGCGNGRFLDVLSRAGAECYGFDLSYSVESAYKNLGNRENVYIVQADLNNNPFKSEIFDVVYSIGVLHHTPSVEKAVSDIAELVKPGGMLAIWVYGKKFHFNLGRFWRFFLSRLPKRWLYNLCKSAKWLYHVYKMPVLGYVRIFFPIAMNPDPEIRVLSTFDSYSPRFAQKTGYRELAQYFKSNKFIDIEAGIFPTSIRGIRPPDTADKNLQ